MRAPLIEFFLAGPPEGFRKQLEQFAARAKRRPSPESWASASSSARPNLGSGPARASGARWLSLTLG
eukprot:7530761-Pyramimonas_sp.AAC.1